MSTALRTVIADPSNLPPLIAALAEVLEGSQSYLPLPPASTPAATVANEDLASLMRAGTEIMPGTLIACTSGSTGTPKGALLSASNLRSSGEATAAYLQETFGSKPGAWLLTLPPHHIAGLQVILRSISAGCTPLVASHLVDSAPFTVESFIADTERLQQAYPDRDLYTSLVPTQLERLAANPGTPQRTAALEALASYSAILVGGAASRTELIDSLRTQGIHLTLTYGSSETAGGMVYDGHPLPGASVTIEDPDDTGRGRVILSGPMVARGYRNAPGSPAFPLAGTFVTSDLGTMTDATLSILGRADGAINSAGYKVLPEDVERAVHATLPEVTLADGSTVPTQTLCATGIEDPQFGQAIALAIEGGIEEKDGHHKPTDITTQVRDALRGRVTKHLIPQRAVLVSQLPTSGPGKINRKEVAKIFQQ